MNANELIEWFEGRILYLWDAENEALKVRSWEGDSLISKLSEEIEELKDKLMLAKQSLEIIKGYVK